MKTDRIFIDSNLWIYLSIKSNSDGKHNKILKFFEEKSNKIICTSIQAVNEFHWVLKRKYNIEENEIIEKVNNGIVKVSNVFPININTYNTAISIRDKYKVSFWDSLIIACAYDNKCSILYSEDMHDGLIIENELKIINPLK